MQFGYLKKPLQTVETMAELSSIKLDPDSQLLLDQPLLRLPHELLRKNLKTTQRHYEAANKFIHKDLQAAQKAPSLAVLDTVLAKAKVLKRKLEELHQEEQNLHRLQRVRLEHLQQLHEIPTLADVKYDTWSHTRLDRLLIDYLLRQGYTQSARELAAQKGIEELVDVNVFEDCRRIEKSLLAGRTQECLAWCVENKLGLKKINSNLELELRLQQVIELSRKGGVQGQLEAVAHARKYLANVQDIDFVLRAGGVLAQSLDVTFDLYKKMFSPTRYTQLASQFLKTHHELFALPAQPLLHIALSAGLSALKTPACHSIHALQANANTGAPVCPICSIELNELARNVPYAHHTKSYMEDDPVVLPNGRVFGRDRLKRLNDKIATPKGKVRDPTRPDEPEWPEAKVKKVFIL